MIDEYVLEPGHWVGDDDPDGGGGFCLESSAKPEVFSREMKGIMGATGDLYLEWFNKD